MKANKYDGTTSPKKGQGIFNAYLESVSGKLSSYLVEVGFDKLLIKSKNT